MPPLPPIKLRRLYAHPEVKDNFTIVAEPLPIEIMNQMTDAELEARRLEERRAIEAEWERIYSEN